MSSKYRNLSLHLASLDASEWKANFQTIEQILGFSLPESARQYQAWWSNQMRSQSMSWQLSGWKATALDLPNEEVTFIYVGGEEGSATASGQANVLPLTLDEAKRGLATFFGISPSQIDITIRG